MDKENNYNINTNNTENDVNTEINNINSVNISNDNFSFLKKFINFSKFDFSFDIETKEINLDFNKKVAEQELLSKQAKKDLKKQALANLQNENQNNLTDKERKQLKELKKQNKKIKQLQQRNPNMIKQISTASSKLGSKDTNKKLPSHLEKELLKQMGLGNINNSTNTGFNNINKSGANNKNNVSGIINMSNINNKKKGKKGVNNAKESNNKDINETNNNNLNTENNDTNININNNNNTNTKKEEPTNKGMEAFLKQVKEKNKNAIKTNSETILTISIKQIFLNKYKNEFSTDITNKVKLKQMDSINSFIISDLFLIIKGNLINIFNESLKISSNSDTSNKNAFKEISLSLFNNIKETILIVDSIITEIISNSLNSNSILLELLSNAISSITGIVKEVVESVKKANISNIGIDTDMNKFNNQCVSKLVDLLILNFSYILVSNLKEVNFNLEKFFDNDINSEVSSETIENLIYEANALLDFVSEHLESISNQSSSSIDKNDISNIDAVNGESNEFNLTCLQKNYQMNLISYIILNQVIIELKQNNKTKSNDTEINPNNNKANKHLISMFNQSTQFSENQKQILFPNYNNNKTNNNSNSQDLKHLVKTRDVIAKSQQIIDYDITNLKFYTKFSSIIDINKTTIFFLNFKSTKLIESYLKQEQEKMINKIEKEVIKNLTNSLFVFLLFFEAFYSRINNNSSTINNNSNKKKNNQVDEKADTKKQSFFAYFSNNTIMKNLFSDLNTSENESDNKRNGLICYSGIEINDELVSILNYIVGKFSDNAFYCEDNERNNCVNCFYFNYSEFLSQKYNIKLTGPNSSSGSYNEEFVIKLAQLMLYFSKIKEKSIEGIIKNSNTANNTNIRNDKDIISEYLMILFSVLNFVFESKLTSNKDKLLKIIFNKVDKLIQSSNNNNSSEIAKETVIKCIFQDFDSIIAKIITTSNKLNITNVKLIEKREYIYAPSAAVGLDKEKFKKEASEEIALSQEKEDLKKNLLRLLKLFKDNKQFFCDFSIVKEKVVQIINEFKYNSKDELKEAIIFYFSFINGSSININTINEVNNDSSNVHLIQSINNITLLKQLIFLNYDSLNTSFNYYISDELKNLEMLVEYLIVYNISFNNNSNNSKSTDITTNIKSYDNSMNIFIVNSLSTLEINNNDLHDSLFQLNRLLNIYSSLITKNNLDFFNIKNDLNSILKIKSNFKSVIIYSITIVFFIEKLLQYSYLISNNTTSSKEIEDIIIIINTVMYDDKIMKIKDYNKNIIDSNNNKYDIVNDIKKLNDKVKVDLKDYTKINSFYNSIDLLFKIVSFVLFYKTNKEYFSIDDIEISNEEYIKKDDNDEENKDNNENTETSNNTDDKIKESNVNLEILSMGFTSILTFYKAKINNNEIEKEHHFFLILFNHIQSIITTIVSNDEIFKGLLLNQKNLELFIREYISPTNTQIKTIEYNDKKSIKDVVSASITESTLNMNIIKQSLLESINLNNISILKLPKIKNKLVFLFQEQELFKLFNTKDKVFLKTLSSVMENNYKTTILQQKELTGYLNLIQDEENDNLETVVHKIFSYNTVKFLEFPEEIFNFLQNSQDRFKYNIKSEKKEFYYSLYSYYYSWKTIMSKVEYGFKLYTTNKSFVETIDKYKTLLKFIVEYISKNSHLYEFFLMQTLSLLKLIENNNSNSIEENTINFNNSNNGNNKLDLDLNTNSENIIKALKEHEEKESSIDLISNTSYSNNQENDFSFNSDTYIFILNILYKFIKIFPSLVRFWYDNSQGKLKNTFKNIVYKIILPNLLKDLKAVFTNNKKMLEEKGIHFIHLMEGSLPNYFEFDFKLNEEVKFNVQVKIPANFPLKQLEVSFVSNAHLSLEKKVNMKMNIIMNLNSTLNMSMDNICDNLVIWADNCKEMVLMHTEPCPVCFYYLHYTDKSLPTLSCRTCKKVFHSLCMKEWFKSATDTTCPMCRSKWVEKGRRDFHLNN